MTHPPRCPDDLVATLRSRGIRDSRLLDVFLRVPRASFVPAARVEDAYEDAPVPIGHGQVTTQPSLLAQMVEALTLRGNERVLEIGTGLGFQAAILAALCREVFSVERIDDLAIEAAANLEAAGIRNVTIAVGDGTLGLPEHAPYDAIVTAAAAPEVPRPLVDQLIEGGSLVHPLGPSGDEVVTRYRKEGGVLLLDRELTRAYFVPMIGRHGLRDARG